MYLNLFLVLPFLILGLTSQKQSLEVGDTAVDFNLKNIDGNMISLNSNGDAKGYILVFTSNSCPYAEMYEDRIIALHEKYGNKGYPVLAIQPNNVEKSPDDAFDKMQERAKTKGFLFPYLLDETQSVAQAYGALNTPLVYILNKQANESFKIEYIGAIDNNSRNAKSATKKHVEIVVEALLTQTEITTTKTKAIGCTIKRAD